MTKLIIAFLVCIGLLDSVSYGLSNINIFYDKYVVTNLLENLGTNRWDSPASPPKVYFSPNYGNGDCASNIVAEIKKAQKTVRMEAYQFTLLPVAEALIEAKQRGVDVQIIVDKTVTNSRNQVVNICSDNGVSVLVDRKHNIFHNKMLVIDEQTVITGSYNFTVNASKHNAENLWVIVDVNAAKVCVSNWVIHSSHSIPFKK